MRTVAVSGAYMVEWRAFVRAEAELAGPGKRRSIEELDAELAVLGRMLVLPLGSDRLAELRGRSAALVRATREADRPVKPKDAAKAGAFGLCTSCRAPVLFCRFANGSTMPLDPLPVPTGNVVRTAAGTVRILGEGDDPADLPRFVSHLDSCPTAGRHRGRRTA